MTECTRRIAMRAFAAGAAAFSVSLDEASAAAEPKPPVVDAHLHCFGGAEDRRFPYHSRAPYRPQKPATPEHLMACMAGAGVDNAIVVHPEPYQDDHRYLEYCLAKGEGKLKGVCLFFADRPDSLNKIPAFLKRNEGRIVAMRLHAYAPGRLPPFGSPELKKFWSIASDHDLAIQMHFEPRYAAQLAPYLKSFPKIRVIIDHLGRPMQGTPEEHEVVVGWSQRPGTYIKLSALPDQGKYPHRDVGPIVRRLAKEFSPARMIYGGGFNSEATPVSYRAYRDRARSLISHLSPQDQDLVLGGNAARVFGFA